MREIKFRAWYTFVNKMVDDIQMCASFDPDGTVNTAAGVVLMQYTGLKDKNGHSEVYEGDIISLDGIKIGNKYEKEDLLQEKTNLLIEGMGTKKWAHTEQEARKRGCIYAE